MRQLGISVWRCDAQNMLVLSNDSSRPNSSNASATKTGVLKFSASDVHDA